MNSDISSSEMEVGENELDILSVLIGDDEEKWRNTRGSFIHSNLLVSFS